MPGNVKTPFKMDTRRFDFPGNLTQSPGPVKTNFYGINCTSSLPQLLKSYGSLKHFEKLTLGPASNPDVQFYAKYSLKRQNISFSFKEIPHHLFDDIYNSSQFALTRLVFVKCQTTNHLVNIFKKLLNHRTYENKVYFTVDGKKQTKVSI